MRKDYLAFFISLFVSRLADQILLFIVPLIVFQTTNSVSWAGLAFFFESLPRYLSFPVCGALCDKYPPVRILHISQIYRAVACVIAIALYAVFDGIYWVVILSALCGVLTTQGVMAREILMLNPPPESVAGAGRTHEGPVVEMDVYKPAQMSTILNNPADFGFFLNFQIFP